MIESCHFCPYRYLFVFQFFAGRHRVLPVVRVSQYQAMFEDQTMCVSVSVVCRSALCYDYDCGFEYILLSERFQHQLSAHLVRYNVSSSSHTEPFDLICVPTRLCLRIICLCWPVQAPRHYVSVNSSVLSIASQSVGFVLRPSAMLLVRQRSDKPRGAYCGWIPCSISVVDDKSTLVCGINGAFVWTVVTCEVWISPSRARRGMAPSGLGGQTE